MEILRKFTTIDNSTYHKRNARLSGFSPGQARPAASSLLLVVLSCIPPENRCNGMDGLSAG